MPVPGLKWGDSCCEATNSSPVCCFHLQPNLSDILSVISGSLQEITRSIGELRQWAHSSFKRRLPQPWAILPLAWDPRGLWPARAWKQTRPSAG